MDQAAANAPSALRRMKMSAEIARLMAERALLTEDDTGFVLAAAKIAGQIAGLLRELGYGQVEESGDEELSDDPNSPNYRYADTGYIADSRKERAANQIRMAKEAGQLVQATSIDWDAVEKNPRAAAELIVKSNLFGQVDWSGLEAAGMDPAAGFLIDRVYASIAPAPADSPQSRKDYAVALTTIRGRLEDVKTVKEVRDVLEEILDELRGTNLNEAEADQTGQLRDQINALRMELRALEEPVAAFYRDWQSARADVWPAERALRNRQDRKWKIEPEHQQAVTDAKAREQAAETRWTDALHAANAKKEPIKAQIEDLSKQAKVIYEGALARNQSTPLTRGWISFGPKFLAVLKYRYNTGSAAFRGHVVNAENNKIKDWSWASKERAAVVRGATKSEVSFQLLVADSFERIGGKNIKVESTASLKSAFGLREVQSGNWVLKDPNSARFHVEQSGAAFSDLADVLGIDATHLGLGGRLGMAFGARGSGGKNAARAHYEPVHRVVNLTKMGGGGTLGHELFHAFDNILPALARGAAGAKDEYATSNPEHMPPGPLRDAFAELRRALTTGETRGTQVFDITDSDRRLAKANVDGFYKSSVGTAIKSAGNATDAVLAVDALLAGKATTRKGKKNHETWRRIAVAYYTPEGDSVSLSTGRAMSKYAHAATLLDNGEDGKYWSQDVELAARAFQSWLEDTMEAQGRRNDYLSCKADNKHYDGDKPFPEGEERTRINAAFDKVFAALREAKVFESAAANAQLLDAIFGEQEADRSAERSKIEPMLLRANGDLLAAVRARMALDSASETFDYDLAANTRHVIEILARDLDRPAD